MCDSSLSFSLPNSHLVELGPGWLEVIGDVGVDLFHLPTQEFPELRRLLGLSQQQDFGLALPLVLVDLLGEEPEGIWWEMSPGPADGRENLNLLR